MMMTSITPSPLAPRQAATLLGTLPTYLHSLIYTTPVELLRWLPALGEWCILEVVGHLIETEERGFAGRIRTILAEQRPQLPTWDPSAIAQARRDAERDPGELLAEFITRRAAGVALAESLTADDLDRGGVHPEVGFLTVNDLLHEWIHHDANHLRQVLANIQAYTWPNMGTAQHFSAPTAQSGAPGLLDRSTPGTV